MPYRFNPFTGNLDLVDTNTAAGSDTQVQYNDGGSLAGSADLTWDDSAKELGVGGDINLDDGGTYSTTLQVVTPTANRTISFPDATGTVALVAGSSGQLTYNSAGAQAGLTSASIGSTGQINISLAGAASTPPVSFTGSWFTGGTATTTKPQLLIEPTGTTSTAWSTDGTGLGVNAASGFSGRLLDLQTNGTSQMVVQGDGKVGLGTITPDYQLHLGGGTVGSPTGQIGLGDTGGKTHARIDGYRSAGNFAGELHVYTTTGGGTETRAITIDSAQRVGIGVTAPGSLLHLADAGNIQVGTTTGTKIGTATSQKLGFWNVTPVIQPASADQAALGAVTTVGANTGTPGAGLSLIGDTSTTDQSAALMNDLAALREDLAAAFTLINQLRSDLVAVGVIKGAA